MIPVPSEAEIGLALALAAPVLALGLIGIFVISAVVDWLGRFGRGGR